MLIELSLPNQAKHAWFAWHPVTAYKGDKLVWAWLTTVTRQWTDGSELYACYEYWING